MTRKVISLAEIRDGSLRNVSFEAIAAAKTIAQGGEVVAVLVGESVQSYANELIAHGADRVVVVENDKLKTYTPDGYGQALMAVIEAEKPEGIVFGHTALVRKRFIAEISDKVERRTCFRCRGDRRKRWGAIVHSSDLFRKSI